jgi:hypothetical protein
MQRARVEVRRFVLASLHAQVADVLGNLWLRVLD